MRQVTATTTITPRYQVHIPVKIRKALNLTHHGKVEIIAKNSEIIIKPIKKSKVMSLSGSLKTKLPKNINIDNIRDHIDYSKI